VFTLDNTAYPKSLVFIIENVWNITDGVPIITGGVTPRYLGEKVVLLIVPVLLTEIVVA
jgi:hypothetical protein